jgi:aquaporin Z
MSDTTTTEASPPTLVQKIAAEALGTFVLVFFGCGSILAMAIGFDRVEYVAVALAFGLTVLTMAYAVGHISGGHFNPAVSVGHALAGRQAWKDTGIYAVVQIGAGVVAALTLFIIATLYDLDDAMKGVANAWDQDQADAVFVAAFLLELIGTFVFVFIVLAVTDRRRTNERVPAPVAIGLALTLAHLLLIGFTGASVNPARSIGPALFAGWEDGIQYLWLFILAPVLGGAVAGFAHPLIFGRDGDPVPGSGLTLSKPAGQQGYQQQWQGGQQGQLQGGQWDQQGYQQGQQQWPQQGQQQWPQQGGEQQWQGQQGGQHAAQPEQQWQQPEPPTQHQQWGQQGYQPPEDDGRTQIRPDGQ